MFEIYNCKVIIYRLLGLARLADFFGEALLALLLADRDLDRLVLDFLALRLALRRVDFFVDFLDFRVDFLDLRPLFRPTLRFPDRLLDEDFRGDLFLRAALS